MIIYKKKWKTHSTVIFRNSVIFYLMCVSEELIGISRVGAAEDDGGGSHGGGRFTGKIRPWIAWINPISSAVGGHVLRSLPAIMVTVSISHLTHKKA